MKIIYQWKDIENSDILLLLTIIYLIIQCPYTKVEESFNMQSMHDLLIHKLDIKAYDHLEFPGVVPRSFIGSIFLFLLTYPIHFLGQLILPNYNNLYAQFIYRISIGFISWYTYLYLRQSVKNKFGRRCSQILSIIYLSTFHMQYYMSRSLPNTFALWGCQLSFSLWLERRPLLALIVITPFVIIFRCDLLILVIPWTLQLLIFNEIPLFKSILVGIVAIIVSLTVTVLIDSYFWDRWLWPEGEVLFFNSIENRSSNWGISPPLWYFYNAIPKTLHIYLPFAIISLLTIVHPLIGIESHHFTNSNLIIISESNSSLESSTNSPRSNLLSLSFRKMISYMLISKIDRKTSHWFISKIDKEVLYYSFPSIAFVLLYSLLPHKEWRFIYPGCLPIIFILSAIGIDKLIRLDSVYLPIHFLLPTLLTSYTFDESLKKLQIYVNRGDYDKMDNELSNKNEINVDGLTNSKKLNKISQLTDEDINKFVITRKPLWTVRLSKRTSKNVFLYDIFTSLGFLLIITVSIGISFVYLSASKVNYPGGNALYKLTSTHLPKYISTHSNIEDDVNVHIDVYSAMTGVTRFGHLPQIKINNNFYKINYSKQEQNIPFQTFKFLLSQIQPLNPSLGLPKCISDSKKLLLRDDVVYYPSALSDGLCIEYDNITYEIVDVIDVYDKIFHPLFWLNQIVKTKPAIAIIQRKYP